MLGVELRSIGKEQREEDYDGDNAELYHMLRVCYVTNILLQSSTHPPV
jgi:hypothetical protein